MVTGSHGFASDGVVTLQMILLMVRDIHQGKVDDAKGLCGDEPHGYELAEVVTTGDRLEDCRGIEAKHRRGAMTRKRVERFQRKGKEKETPY